MSEQMGVKISTLPFASKASFSLRSCYQKILKFISKQQQYIKGTDRCTPPFDACTPPIFIHVHPPKYG